MKILTSHITVGNLSFDFVHKVEVHSAWKLFTDTAKVQWPAHLKINKDMLLQYIRFGDQIRIETGYGGKNNTIFIGYVTGIKPSVPVEIQAEDHMWKLKQTTVSFSLRSATLSQVLNDYFTDVETVFNDMDLGPFYVQDLTLTKVLDKLKSQYGLYSFFREGKLWVGKIYDSQYAKVHKFRLDYNIVKDDLVFKRKEEVRLKVRAVSVMPDGTKTEVELGDPDGELRSLHFYNVPADVLRRRAEALMDQLKYDGWRGKFTAFGEPFVRHGDIVELTHPDGESEKTGRYWVDKVVYQFGINGYRQEIYLGPKA